MTTPSRSLNASPTSSATFQAQVLEFGEKEGGEKEEGMKYLKPSETCDSRKERATLFSSI